MRDIWFRAKRIDNGEWVEGYYVALPDAVEMTHIIHTPRCDPDDSNRTYFVDPDTIGQYIGLEDKHGKIIYEGDIAAIDPTVFDVDEENRYGKVFWDNEASRFTITISDRFIDFDNCRCYNDIEVVGNIYDNPGLIGGDNK